MIRREGLRTKDRDLTSVTIALKKSSTIENFISPAIKLRMCKLIAIAREAGDRFSFMHQSGRNENWQSLVFQVRLITMRFNSLF
jgi:hypothetical protein